MRIGIDISQIVFEGTGVANYTKNLVENLLRIDKKNEYVLFFSSLRRKFLISPASPRRSRGRANFEFLNGSKSSPSRAKSMDKPQIRNSNFQIKTFKFPPLLLEFLWNKLHICPIEWFIGEVDVFLSSDWVQPPTIKAKKVTTIHDLIVYKHPESFQRRGGHDIVANQKRRLKWVKKECDLIICDSEATKKDAVEILKIPTRKLKVIYPGGRC